MAKIADNVILIYNSYLWLIIASIIIDWPNNKIPFYQFSNYFSNNDIKRSLHALPSIFKKSKRDNYLKKKKKETLPHLISFVQMIEKIIEIIRKGESHECREKTSERSFIIENEEKWEEERGSQRME